MLNVKGLLFLINLLLVPFYLFSQQNVIDKVDSLKILIRKSRDNNDGNLKRLLLELSRVYEYNGNWNEYDNVISEMFEVAEKENNLLYKAECFNKLGISSSLKGNNTKAILYFYKVLSINISLKKTLSIANSFENLSKVYKDLGLYDSAYLYLKRSIVIREKVEHPRLFNCYIDLSNIFSLMENSSKEFLYLRKAHIFLLNRRKVQYSDFAILHNEIGGYYNRKNINDSAISNYNKVIYFSKLADWKLGIAVGYGNLAEMYFKLGYNKMAINLHHMVLELSIKTDNCMGIAEEYQYLSRIYEVENNLDSALFFAQKSLERTQKCNLLKEQINNYNILYNIYEAKGNYEQSLYYYKKYHKYKDSIYNIEKEKIIASIEAKYQSQKKEQEILLLKASNDLKNGQILLSIAVISILFLLLVIIFFIMKNRKIKADEMKDRLKQQLFRSQMKPHFLFNALASIQGYMLKNKTKEAADYLGHYSGLTRRILEHSSKEKIPLFEEIESIKSYIKLEQIQLNKPFEYKITYNKDMDIEAILIPPMMIQPFVENTFKHAFKSISYKAKLDIFLTEYEDFINIKILDNGSGYPKQIIGSKRASMSIKIFEHRAKILSKKTKQKIKLNIINRKELNFSQKGTMVEFNLPIFDD